MSRHPMRAARLLVAGTTIALVALAGCGDDDGGDEPSPGTTAPFVDGTGGVLDSTGRSSGGSVLNNQPTTPAVNNAPPGDDGTG